MRSLKTVTVIGCHAEGEVGRVVTGGVLAPPGRTVFEKMQHFRQHQDDLRKFLLFEPRGGAFVHANLIVPACDPRAHAGFIVMEATEYPPMSGTNSMCVATVLLETGMLPMTEPLTHLTLECPGGLIGIEATCRDGKCERVRVVNVPSFVAKRDIQLDVPGVGRVRADIAYGGAFFVIVEAQDLDLAIVPDEARRIVDLGHRITRVASEAHPVRHPVNAEIYGPTFTQFVGKIEHAADGSASGRNAVVVYPGKIDRSPCGTGTSAWLSLLHAKGVLATGQRFVSRSILDAQFECRIESTADVAGTIGIVPSFAGRAWITDVSQYLLDPQDPYPHGYTLNDTWAERLT